MTPVNNVDSHLSSIFKGEELKDLQNCINRQQRSWTTIISDNKVNIITFVACTTIAHVALSYTFASMTTAFIFVTGLKLYAKFKLDPLEKEANATLAKTKQVFVIDKIITKHGDNKGLGSLSKTVLKQVIKDQKSLNRIHTYQTLSNWAILPIYLTSLCIDQKFKDSLFPIFTSKIYCSRWNNYYGAFEKPLFNTILGLGIIFMRLRGCGCCC